MRSLQQALESLLDSDFDIELTWGDVYEFKPDFGLRGPSDFKGYAWDKDGFWSQYEGVRNSWTENKYIARKNPIRLRYIKSDIRHGFAMFILTRPIDAPMDQRAVDGYVRQMNEWCDRNKLELDVHVSKVSGGIEFAMWNLKILGEPTKSFMGKFTITRKTTSESILDNDFDIQDSDLAINNVYPFNHKMWQIIPALMDRIYQNASKAFFQEMPSAPEHIVDSHLGTRNMIRYFLDWLATQPIGMLNDDQFTASKPKLVEAFAEWIKNPKFNITMAKMGKSKYVYFNYKKNQILRVNFE